MTALHDSGERRQFATGAIRDAASDKVRYDLIPLTVLTRLAQHYTNGSQKYEDRNWQKGIPVSVYYASLMRHLVAVMNGKTDEDHTAAAMWNVAGIMWTLEQIETGNLPVELDDRETLK
jgi:hypothetical protein